MTKSILNYISEARQKIVKPSEWYENDKYKIEGVELPKSITDKIKFYITQIDYKQPITVFVEKDDKNIYTLTFGNIKSLYGTWREFYKIINTGTKIKTLENCELEIRSGASPRGGKKWPYVTNQEVGDILKYFKENNSETHFSQVVFYRFDCGVYDRFSKIENIIPSNLVYFSECVKLPELDFSKINRKDLKFYSDKSTVNGKLKLLNLLNEDVPEIKVVIRKSEVEKLEREARAKAREERNLWKKEFDFKRLKYDITEYFDDNDIEDIYVGTKSYNYLDEYEKNSWGTYTDYLLDISIRLEGIKSYGDPTCIEREIILDLKDDKYVIRDNINTSNTCAKYAYKIAKWVQDNLYNNYKTNPPTVYCNCLRELCG